MSSSALLMQNNPPFAFERQDLIHREKTQIIRNLMANADIKITLLPYCTWFCIRIRPYCTASWHEAFPFLHHRGYGNFRNSMNANSTGENRRSVH